MTEIQRERKSKAAGVRQLQKDRKKTYVHKHRQIIIQRERNEQRGERESRPGKSKWR